MTLYLKTETEAAMKSALSDVIDGFIGSDGNGDEMLVFYTHKWAVDWDIPIIKTPAVLDDEGNVTTQPVMEDGFFANVQVHDLDIDTTSIEALDQQPETPQRRFA
jgi:hypothetical protein